MEHPGCIDEIALLCAAFAISFNFPAPLIDVILLLLSVVFIIVATTKLKLHPFLALLVSAFGYGVFCGKMSLADVVKSVNSGFGGTI